ncbi:Ig-like domain-containing protein [Teredinibacter haidensis]|uniref:Ig-like domain-containing protein n=1 Tax=Teredinibacter haidensis TaxID=2731755 RepID=UPI00163CAF3B|nr:Ig-like domain-containing protein [Teredinibacter haidensis]
MVFIPQTVRFIFVVVFTSLLLVACGGGGGGSRPTPTPQPTPAPDTTPAAFSFTAQTDVALAAVVESANVTIGGIDAAAAISVTDNGEYSIGDGAYTKSTGTITNGQTVKVKVTASDQFSTPVAATLTVGGVTSTFTATTLAIDVDPEPFELGDDASVSTPEATAESSLVTIAGINAPANISIDNGEYRIVGESEYSTAASTITVGQQVQVRVTAGAALNSTETATLTIGNQSDTFAVTIADQSAPTAQVIFPTANTMSDGTTVTLRGKATDDFGPVTSIEVTVTTDEGTVEVDKKTFTAATDEDLQETWSVQVNLASEKLNTLQVLATDVSGNIQETPVTLTVLQKADALTSLFPEDNDVLIGAFTYFGIEWDQAGNRLFIPRRGPDQILAVDIDTGTRSVLVDEDPVFDSFSMLKLLPKQNVLLFADQNEGVIYSANLETGDFSVLTDSSSPDSNVDIQAPFSMELGSNGLLYVAEGHGSLYTVSMDTGSRTLISGPARPESGLNPFANPLGLVLDEVNNRALLADITTEQLLWVDLVTGVRTVWVDSDQLDFPFDIKMDADDERIVLVDHELEVIFAVGLDTGELTTLSGPSIPVSGANSLQEPWGIVIHEENDIAFVGSNSKLDGLLTAIILVDLTTGERIIVTSSIQ